MKVFQELKLGGLVELARAVQDSPCLYDSTDVNYRQKECRVKAWKTIAKRSGLSESRCQSLWKAMRDKYVRGRKKELSASKLGLPASGARDTWSLDGVLDFLKPHVKSRFADADDDGEEMRIREIPSLDPPSFVLTNIRRPSLSVAETSRNNNNEDEEPPAKISRNCDSLLDGVLHAFAEGKSEKNKANLLFGMSVAAELDGMSEEKRKTVKLEILKIIYS